MKRSLLLSFVFLAALLNLQAQNTNVDLASATVVDSFPFTDYQVDSSNGGSFVDDTPETCFALCCSLLVYKVVVPSPGYLRADMTNFTPLTASMLTYTSELENPTQFVDLDYASGYPGNFCGFRDSLELGRNPEIYTNTGNDDITSPQGPIGPGTFYDKDTYYIIFFNHNNQTGQGNLLSDITINFTPRCPEGATCASTSYTDCDGVPYTSPTGNVYSESGSYIDTLYNANSMGGDSIIYTKVEISNIVTTEIAQDAMPDISSCSNSSMNQAAISNYVSYGEFVKADGDWVEIDEVADEIAGTNRSVSAWIKHPNQVSGSSQMIVGMNTSGTATVSNLLIGTNEKIGIYDGGSFRYGTSVVTDGNWHHIAYTYDETTHGTIIYVDGVVEKTYTNGQSITASGRVSIGQEYDGSSTGNYFDGFITEVSIWDEVLSESEILLLKQHAINDAHPKYANLKAYYTMNPTREGCTTSLSDIKDSSGNNLHGVASSDILSISTYDEISGFNSAGYFDKSWTYNGNLISNSDSLQLNTPYSGSYGLTLTRDHIELTEAWEMSTNSNCVEYDWGQVFDGDENMTAYAVKSDHGGYIYTVGSFKGTADFDPSSGTSNLTSAGDHDIFVQKVNINGDFVWAKRIGSAGDDQAYNLTIDSNNNVYISGQYNNTVDFDPGSGTTNITSAGGDDAFIVKLDSSGDFIWAKSMGGSSPDKGIHMEFDHEDHLIVSGEFGSNPMTIDPGSGNPNLARPSAISVFVIKFDTNGTYIWAKAIGGFATYNTGLSIDNDNNVFFAGYSLGDIDLDPGAGEDIHTLVGTKDAFVVKLNSNGDYQWGKSLANTGEDTFIWNIATDNSGSVYSIGEFFGTLDIDPSSNTTELTSIGNADVFVQKLDSSGNFMWAKSVGGLYNENPHSIKSDGENVYILYDFRLSIDVDPTDAVETFTTTRDDFVISKFANNGTYNWSYQINTNHYGTYIASMNVNEWGNVIASGRLYSNTNIDFDYSGDNDVYSSGASQAIFLTQLNDASTFQNHTYYATNSGSGLQNGYSAEDATPSLSALMGTIKSGDEVYVMDGQLNETSNILIPANTTVNITDGATVNTGVYKLDNHGQINIASNAALVQATGGVIAGNGSFKIERSAGSNTALFNFLSSPINNINVQQVFAGSNCVAFDPAEQSNGLNGWSYILTDDLVNGHGYAVNGANTEDFNGVRIFNGTANNGDIDVALNGQTYGGSYDGWNLLGNPYPSSLDMKNYIDNNSDVGAVTLYDQSTGMYVTYNTLNADGLYIASGQGFFVEFSTANSGTANFNNSMRYESAGTIEKNASVAKAILRIENQFGKAYDTYIGFTEAATDEFDSSYDARLIPGANDVTIFSMLNDEAMAIQGLKANQEKRIIPIGIESLGGELSISLSQLEQFASDIEVILIDNLLHKKHQLKIGAYHFIADEGLYTSRFELEFKRNRQTMYDFSDIAPVVSLQEQQIVIDNIENIAIESVRLFDLSGKLVAQWNDISSSSQPAYLEIQNHASAVYLIEIISGKNVYHEKINVQ